MSHLEPHIEAQIEAVRAYEKKLGEEITTLRKMAGEAIVAKTMSDDNAPKILKEIIREWKISYIGFEEVIVAADYMPDSCYFVTLKGILKITLRTEEKTPAFDECNLWECDGPETRSEDDFAQMVKEYNLLQREVTDEEGAEAHRYIANLLQDAKKEYHSAFAHYILEEA